MQVLRVRHDQQAVRRLHVGHRRPGRPRRRGARARGLQRDPHGGRREPAPRLPLLHRPDPRASRGAAGRAPQAVHGLRGAPHAQALGQAQAGDPRGAQGRGAGVAAGRRRRGVRRPRAQADRPGQGASGRVAGDPPGGPCAGHADALHDALRPRRELRGADRPPAAAARPAGRHRRVPGLHPAAVPPREHRVRAARLAVLDRLRRPQDAGRVAADARQLPEHQGVLDHDLDAARPDRPALRRERHPGHGDGGEDRPRRRRRDAAGGEGAGPGGADPRRRPHARAARLALQHRCGGS